MSFLKDYEIYTSGNEAPSIFHTWSGFSVLSTCASRKVWLDQGPFIVRPNMYIILVGAPASKKSTAMSLARGLVQEVNYFPIAPASITKEALTKLMAEDGSPCKKVADLPDGSPMTYTHLSIFANELVVLINSGGNALGMIDFLTEIWDQDMLEIKTKNKGSDIAKNPFVTVLGCMTPDRMANLLYEKIISGGFNRRAIFVKAVRAPKAIPFPEITPEQREAQARCLQRCKEILKLCGPFAWTDSGKKAYQEFYDANFARIDESSSDAAFQGYLNSKGEYVIKLSMLIGLSERNDLVVEDWQVKAACMFLAQIEDGYREIFSSSGRNEFAPLLSSIEQLLKSIPDGAVPTSALYRKYRNEANENELNQILAQLVKEGSIIQFSELIRGNAHHFIGLPGSREKIIARLQKDSPPATESA
jgi:hypothetical protein